MVEPSVSVFTYRAFLSYSHRDKASARWLHHSLETYRVPARLVGRETARGKIPRRLNPVFRDREELSSASELGHKLNAALVQSENLLVICSPASAASRWVNEEVLTFKRLGRSEHVFCLIVGGEPNASDLPGRAAEECFCPALRFKLDADGRLTSEHAEPLAADLRPGKDGKGNAKLKLVAGMLDIGFDVLKQREQRRQMRWMMTVTAAAVAVMAVTIALSTFALISRHEALIAHHQAELAQQAAQRRQKQAEGLVDFMLRDLTAKLEAESRLDILKDVDNKAMAYFQSLPPSDVSTDALEERATALEGIGDVRMQLGDATGALQAFRASTAISSRLAAAAPMDPGTQAAYARTLTYIGLIHQYAGNLDAAQHSYALAQGVLQAALKRSPNNLNVMQQLTYVENNLGALLSSRGKTGAAGSEYREMLAASKKLVTALKGNDGAYETLIYAHRGLAGLDTSSGNLAAAVVETQAAVAAALAADKNIPKDEGLLDFTAQARTDLGMSTLLVGATRYSADDLRQAGELAAQITRIDPKNTFFQVHFAYALTQLAKVQAARHKTQAANVSLSKALQIVAKLMSHSHGSTVIQRYFAATWILRAEKLHGVGNLRAARSLARRALNIIQPIFSKQPDDRATLLTMIRAKLTLASVTGRPADARNLREQSLQTIEVVTGSRNDPRLLALRVEALLALGRQVDTEPLIKQLWSSGYRDPDFLAVLQHAHIAYPVNEAFANKLAAAMRSEATLAASGANPH